MKRHPAMEKLRRELGLAIRTRRKQLRLSQEELAEHLGLHRNYISLVERGIQNITVETLFKLSFALDCSPASLLAETESPASADAPSVLPPAETGYPPLHPSVWRVAETDARP